MLAQRYQSSERKLNKSKSVYAYIYMEVPRRISISSGSPSKRARAPPAETDDDNNNTTKTMTQSRRSPEAAAAAQGTNLYYCLVDGCSADLSACRDYHRRHKVCEIHSKTPKVTISGREQRFCQQCSRFHSLVEFDEGKRSCRKRLDGHNRRRRKSHPLPRNSSGLVSFGGSRRVSRSSPEMLQVPNNDQDTLLLYNQQQLILNNCSNMICSEASSSFSADQYKGLLMLQNSQVPSAPLLDHPESSHIQKNMFDDNSVHDALSLLSSPSTTTLPHLMSMHHPDQHNPHPLLLPDHPQNNYYSSSSSSSSSSLSLSSSCCGGGGPYSYPPLTQQHCMNDTSTPHLFQHGPPHVGSPTTTTTTNGSHQTLTFMWE